jgi:hypothetical protein
VNQVTVTVAPPQHAVLQQWHVSFTLGPLWFVATALALALVVVFVVRRTRRS